MDKIERTIESNFGDFKIIINQSSLESSIINDVMNWADEKVDNWVQDISLEHDISPSDAYLELDDVVEIYDELSYDSTGNFEVEVEFEFPHNQEGNEDLENNKEITVRYIPQFKWKNCNDWDYATPSKTLEEAKEQLKNAKDLKLETRIMKETITIEEVVEIE